MLFSQEKYQNIHGWLLAFIALLIPLNLNYAKVALGFVIFFWLIHLNLTKLKRLLHWLPWMLISLYLIHLLGLLCTSNMREGLQDVETKMSLYIFPLFFFIAPITSEIAKKRIVYAFVLGCFLCSCCCIGLSTYDQIYLNKYNWFSSALSGQMDYHGTFMSVYISFSICILFYYFDSLEQKISNLPKLGFMLITHVFLIMMILLFSRMAILALIFSLLLYVIWFWKKSQFASKMLGLWIMFLLALGVFVFPSAGITEKTSLDQEQLNEDNVRYKIYKSALVVCLQEPIFGHGTGDIHDKLMEEYRKQDYQFHLKHQLSYHNQYLQLWAIAGIFGLLLLLINICIPFFISLNRPDYQFTFFIILLSIAFLTESMLESEEGVIFYAFFNSLFLSFSAKRED